MPAGGQAKPHLGQGLKFPRKVSSSLAGTESRAGVESPGESTAGIGLRGGEGVASAGFELGDLNGDPRP
ncbi:unnamed protein product [Caretta caretta]